MMELLTSPEAWMALVTLTSLEIVLGIDNIIFISILAGRLPESQRARARTLGLGMAMISRILLLLSITWIMGLTEPLFSIAGEDFSWRDIILGAGGLFLLAKSTMEIHHGLEGEDEAGSKKIKHAAFTAVIIQIMIIDIVFSLDSVITAVGMAEHLSIMIAAVIIAVGVMMISAQYIGEFVEHHPTIKMLALSFLILIGTALCAEALGLHIPKGYIYFAMFFSVGVELLNMRLRRKLARKPVRLHKSMPGSGDISGDNS